MKYLLNGCAYVCRFRGGCGWVWSSLVIHGQEFAKMDMRMSACLAGVFGLLASLGIYGQDWSKVGRSR